MIRFIAAVVLAAVAPGVARGQCQTSPIAQFGGWMEDGVVVDDVAYIANGYAGVLMLDVSSPDSPSFLGFVELTFGEFRAFCAAVHLDGDTLYATVAETTIDKPDFGIVYAIDVADPSAPSVTGMLELPDRVGQLDVQDGLAYVLMADASVNDKALLIIDVNDPADMSVIGEFPLAGTGQAVRVVDQIAYVANDAAGFLLVDVSDAASPELISSYVNGQMFSLAIDGSVAYLGGTAGILSIDISDPLNLELIGFEGFGPGGLTTDLCVDGDVLYASRSAGQFSVVDITDPAEPVEIADVESPYRARALSLHGDTLFVFDRDAGLQVYDVAMPQSPSFVSDYFTPQSVPAVHIEGDIAIAPSGAFFSPGLFLVDVADPGQPLPLATMPLEVQPGDVVAVADLVYLPLQDGGALVFDITDPTTPVQIGQYESDVPAGPMLIDGDLAFMGTEEGVLVLDVADPTQPQPLGLAETDAEMVFDMSLDRGLIFAVARSEGLIVIDYADPAKPAVIATLPLSDARGVHVDGDYALVADDVQGLVVIDVSDPTTPMAVVQLDEFSGADLTVQEDLAYVAAGETGLILVDVADPIDPQIISQMDTPYNAADVRVMGDAVFVADSQGGLRILDVECAACPADMNGDGVLNVLDFVAFQLLWQAQDAAADCDANRLFNVLDFVCFQVLFQAGCGN